MNTPILTPMPETDTLRGVLRPCAPWPRPIPCLKIAANSQLGGQR
jgi:hypothetical protein